MTVSLKMNTSGGYTLARTRLPWQYGRDRHRRDRIQWRNAERRRQARRITPARLPLPRMRWLAYCVSNQSSITPSVSGDLILDAIPDGNGPVEDCDQNASTVCVFDYGSSTSWSGTNNGDQQSYSNGDGMAHYYASTASAVAFNFGTGTANPVDSQVIAFKASSGRGGAEHQRPGRERWARQ